MPDHIGAPGGCRPEFCGAAAPQVGQMHARPRRASGTAASAAAESCADMHQQESADCPAATAHWLPCPHKGQTLVSRGGCGICRHSVREVARWDDGQCKGDRPKRKAPRRVPNSLLQKCGAALMCSAQVAIDLVAMALQRSRRPRAPLRRRLELQAPGVQQGFGVAARLFGALGDQLDCGAVGV